MYSEEMPVFKLPSLDAYRLIAFIILIVPLGCISGGNFVWLVPLVAVAIIALVLVEFWYYYPGKLQIVYSPYSRSCIHVMVGYWKLGATTDRVAYFLPTGLRIITFTETNATIDRSFVLRTNQSFSFGTIMDDGVLVKGYFVMRDRWIADTIRYIINESVRVDSDGRLNGDHMTELLTALYAKAYNPSRGPNDTIRNKAEPMRAGEEVLTRVGFDVVYL